MMEIPENKSERQPFGVTFDDKLKLYRISGAESELVGLGCRLYAALGGSEMAAEQCEEALRAGRELRPKSIYAIRLPHGRLEVDNRNMRNDPDANARLADVIANETK